MPTALRSPEAKSSPLEPSGRYRMIAARRDSLSQQMVHEEPSDADRQGPKRRLRDESPEGAPPAVPAAETERRARAPVPPPWPLAPTWRALYSGGSGRAPALGQVASQTTRSQRGSSS